MKRLNLGCGSKRLDGYINVDIVPSSSTDLVADIVRLPMFNDESVDEIRMDAVYEHLYRHERPAALNEWLRILRPGGRLGINWIPDFDAVVEAYCQRRPGIQNAVFDIDEVWRLTHGGYASTDVPFQVHKDIFTEHRVIEELENAGFENVAVSKARYGDEPVAVNLNAIAKKPDGSSRTSMLLRSVGTTVGAIASDPRLSVVINTLNEERDLEECLRSVKGCADEIVVVDMRSDDRTVEIARRYTTRILLHERTGVVEPARQFAIDQALGEWIMVLDADERITPELARLIRQVITRPTDTVAYRVQRRNLIAGRWMTGTGWGADVERHIRLFRRGTVSWPREVHAVPSVHGQVENLAGSPEAVLLHLNYRDLREFLERLNTYTDFEADKLLAVGEIFTWSKAVAAALAEVRHRYEPHKDGVHSLVLSLCMAFYRFLSWAKLWERCGYPEADLPGSWEELLPSDRAVQSLAPLSGRPSYLDQGDRALRAGAWAEASEAYIEVLKREPGCAAARSGLGLGLVALGDPDEGLAQLTEAVRISPQPDWVCNLASGLLHVGRMGDAQKLLEGILAVEPDHALANENLARLRAARSVGVGASGSDDIAARMLHLRDLPADISDAIRVRAGSAALLPGVSAHLIVRNEVELIDAYLDNTLPYVDELIILDGGSTDGTSERIRARSSKKVRLFLWPQQGANFSVGWREPDRRNVAIALTNHQWILKKDADEFFLEEDFARLREVYDGSQDQLVCFPRLNFWKDLYHIRVNTDSDPHWYPDMQGNLWPAALRLYWSDEPLHCHLLKNDVLFAHTAEWAWMPIYHYHWALGKRVKANDLRRGDLVIDRSNIPPEGEDRPVDIAHVCWEAPNVRVQDFTGTHPSAIAPLLRGDRQIHAICS
jgi:glycosyltransferase involved in cell wall biosynthesis/predicted SAM-dependent methyltransferase